LVRSIGLDVVETARIAKNLEKHGDRFVGRVLGKLEKDLLEGRQDTPQFLAGRFAAKEAVIKALRPYLKDKPPLSEIQILRCPDGAPELHLPEALTKKLGGARCMLSISHEKNYAAAVAIFVEET